MKNLFLILLVVLIWNISASPQTLQCKADSTVPLNLADAQIIPVSQEIFNSVHPLFNQPGFQMRATQADQFNQLRMALLLIGNNNSYSCKDRSQAYFLRSELGGLLFKANKSDTSLGKTAFQDLRQALSFDDGNQEAWYAYARRLDDFQQQSILVQKAIQWSFGINVPQEKRKALAKIQSFPDSPERQSVLQSLNS